MKTTQKPFFFTGDETEKFRSLAADWWEEDGAFKGLHAINRLRTAYIKTAIQERFDCVSLAGKRVLDLGCGGGLTAESMARAECCVTAVDPVEETIKAARAHASREELTIDYQVGTLKDLPAGETFDAVLALEMLEHVANPETLIRDLCERVSPGGVMILSTINRTMKSLIFAKAMAEYVLHWVPPGTHDPRRFLKPSELARPLRESGFHIEEVKGLTYAPLSTRWHFSDDVSINYMLKAIKQD